MKHDYYVVRTHGYRITVYCRECKREWAVKPQWTFLFLALRNIIIWGYIGLFLIFRFDKVWGFVGGIAIIHLAWNLPAQLLCLYMKKTGDYERYFEQ